MKGQMRTAVVVAIALAALAMSAGCLGADTGDDREPSITVTAQPILNNQVTIDSVFLDEPGYVVIHANAGGQPGATIGHSDLISGEASDVTIDVGTGDATPLVYAMLHYDDGDGEYEFPGDDGPTTVNGTVVMMQFRLTNIG